MKTLLNPTTAQENQPKKYFGFFLFFSLFLLVSINAKSQDGTHNCFKNFGIGTTSTITSSGHGTFYSLRVQYTSKRTTLSFGPVVQKRNMNLSGFQAGFEYTLFADGITEDMGNDFENYSNLERKVELFAFASSIYNNSAYLSKSEIRMECSNSEEKTKSFEDLKLKTFENYTGVGLRIKFTDQLKWTNSIGVGGYVTLSSTNEMTRERQAIGLLLRTGLTYQFGKSN